nr:pancreatic triacylglycerol lipase-like [Onthophagus taurus]
MLVLCLTVISINFYILNVDSYNFSKETCQDDLNKLLTELLNPLNFIQGVDVYSDDLEYILFTNNNPNEEIVINETTRHLIDPTIETKIFISGWLEGYNIKWILEMRDIYLKKSRYNIIVFNWDQYSYMHYIFSTELCRELGKNLGDFISDLVITLELDLNKIHIIGHSLGAQIAGFTGQRVMKRLYRRIGRISALDAAGPIFNFNTESYRLDRNDANFVDAIHTNNFFFGYYGPCGTVDVFVNNGIFQEGCPTIYDIMRSMRCEDIHRFLFCSHSKSIEVWKRSINENLIGRHLVTGYPIVIGENVNLRSDGY